VGSQQPIEEGNQDSALDMALLNVLPIVSAPIPETMPPGAPPIVSVPVLHPTLPDVAPVIPAPVPAPVVILPAVLPAALPLPQPGNTWLAATNLIIGDDGRLQQSAQSPEISKYISKTVRLASLKVFFIDAFPDPVKQNDWLTQSLVTVLQEHAKTDQVAHQVNLRAQQDHQYMTALMSMVCCWADAPFCRLDF
jgi:hypothetical protein